MCHQSCRSGCVVRLISIKIIHRPAFLYHMWARLALKMRVDRLKLELRTIVSESSTAMSVFASEARASHWLSLAVGVFFLDLTLIGFRNKGRNMIADVKSGPLCQALTSSIIFLPAFIMFHCLLRRQNYSEVPHHFSAAKPKVFSTCEIIQKYFQ